MVPCMTTATKPKRLARYRIALVRDGSIPLPADRTVGSAADAAAMLTPLIADLDREHFLALMLDTRHRAIGFATVSVGSLNMAIVAPRETFKAAILMNAATIVVAHNHPSGDPVPSREDMAMTERLVLAGRVLDIPVLDSLVLTHTGTFTSLRDSGLL